MAACPWTISVLSTNYDLCEYRKAIISEFESKNIVVSAYEHSSFPVEADLHSHESCLVALDRADLAILVIDKRFGGIYFNDENHELSITQKEFLTAVEQKIPCFVFVSQQSWAERHTYKELFKSWREKQTSVDEDGQPRDLKKEFDQQYTCTYVESVQTIDFIESIQHCHAKYDASNWITTFSDIPDLLKKMTGKLRGHSRHLLEELVQAQKESLGNRHTSTGFSLSLNDVFSRGYYLEPTFEIESGCLVTGDALDTQLQKTLQNDTSVLVYGEAGYGKTTVLAKSYFSHVEDFLNKNSYKIPFYLWLKKKTCNYHFDFKTYIIESFEEDLHKSPYPYLDLTNIKPFFYFDGFDEVAEKMTPAEVEKIRLSDMFKYPVLLTCRQQYANRYANNYLFADKFGARVRIDTWNREKAQEYINNFCRIKGKDKEFLESIHKLLSENASLSDILNSPLLVTMLLWIVEQNRMKVPETIRTRIQLFSACVDCLAKRELNRLGISEIHALDLVLLWSLASWEVYLSKLNGDVAKISDLMETLKEQLPDIPFEYSVSFFEALFDCSNDQVFGTFHEQFLEFLVANRICLACQEKQYPYPDFLQYVMRPEINRYFRGLWNERPKDAKNSIVKNLREIYNENLGDNSFQAVSKRVHAVYHICRFADPGRADFIQRAFNIEDHISVKLSLYFGAIKMGDIAKEQEFFDLLQGDEKYNEANRGYHLAYYSDAVMGKELPFTDDLQCNWKGTLSAILRHFQSTEEGHYYLRRIELATMTHFIEARKAVGPLTEDILNDFLKLIEESSKKQAYPEFEAKIESAFSCLKLAYDSAASAQT